MRRSRLGMRRNKKTVLSESCTQSAAGPRAYAHECDGTQQQGATGTGGPRDEQTLFPLAACSVQTFIFKFNILETLYLTLKTLSK